MKTMLRWLLVLAVVALPGAALAAEPLMAEKLVLTSATTVDLNTRFRKGLEIQNLGPNAIFCAVGDSSLAVVNKARKVDASGGTWAIDLPPGIRVYCIAASANQVTGAATIVTEAR